MNVILANLFVGVFIMPVLLFLVAFFFTGYRARKGLAPLPPNRFSLLILLLTLLSWAIAGFNILFFILRK